MIPMIVKIWTKKKTFTAAKPMMMKRTLLNYHQENTQPQNISVKVIFFDTETKNDKGMNENKNHSKKNSGRIFTRSFLMSTLNIWVFKY